MPKYEALIFRTDGWTPQNDKETLTDVVSYEVKDGFILFTTQCPYDGQIVVIYPHHAVKRVAIRERL